METLTLQGRVISALYVILYKRRSIILYSKFNEKSKLYLYI